MRYGVSVLALVVAIGLQPARAQERAHFVGRPLSEALGELQSEGLQLVFSSAVVTPSMVVEHEPIADTPRGILDQLLEPHGLRAEEGPRGTLVVLVASSDESELATGRIVGLVTVGGNRSHTTDLAVTVEGMPFRAKDFADGRFSIDHVPEGLYTVSASASGYTTQTIDEVSVRPGRTARLRFDLFPVSVFLNEVIVTPSHFKLLDEHPERRQFLSREEVAQMPHAADDLYRAVKRLPGSAGGDFTAKINVRGGDQDELLVVLDGLELYEPFHLKDFQSVFSIIDSEAVGGVDFLTGGFPVEYGDRMSGVMDISTATLSGPTATSIELSTINGRLLSHGSFNRERGQWFVSARVWYPDAIVGNVSDRPNEVLTDYYDLLAKIQHQLGRHSLLSANLLVAYDDLGYQETDEEEVQKVRAEYGSYSAWLNLHSEWSEALYSQTVLSAGRLKRHRTGSVSDILEGNLDVDDRRSFEFLGLGQDWIFETGDRNVLKWGFDVIHQEAVYDYESLSTLEDANIPPGSHQPPTVIDTHLEPEGPSFAAYVADRFRVIDPLVVELGLRWDRQNWIGDHQLSPRINMVYTVGPRTVVRAAWGRFYQSQRLNELQIEDGVQEFFPAQLAKHWMVSLEHSFRPGLASRFEIFRKDLLQLRPRYENLFNPIQLFPESSPDRIRIAPDRGLVRGVEVVFKGSAGTSLTWWASYVMSRAEDRIDGAWERRSWDQRHALTAGLNVNFAGNWSLSFSGQYHSGWPTTELTAEAIPEGEDEPEIVTTIGLRNASSYPAYGRLDLRISKLFPTDYGEFKVYLEILNLTNRKNICCTEDFELEVEDDLSVTVTPEYRNWAPFIPTLGFGWRF